jgi:hypothetical protein
MKFSRKPETNLMLGRFLIHRGFRPIFAKGLSFSICDSIPVINSRAFSRWRRHSRERNR